MANPTVSSHSDLTPNEEESPLPFYTPSLEYLPDDDSTYYVYSIQGFTSEGPEIDDLRIRVVMIKFPAVTPPREQLLMDRLIVDVPLSDFRFFGMGSTFFKRQQVSRKFDSTERGLLSFRPRTIVEGFIGRTRLEDPAALHIQSRSSIESFKAVHRHDGVALLESVHRGQPIYAPMMEVFRFYFGSFDRLTRQLLLCYAYPEMEASLPWEEETTGSDGETFVISPHPDFADHASCLQMALLLSNPDLMEILKSIANGIRGLDLTVAVLAPVIEFPYDAKNMRALVRQTHLRREPKGPYEKARIVQQILSDNRDMKYSRLLIRDPRREPAEPRKKVQGPSKPKKKIEAQEDTNNPPDGSETHDPYAPVTEHISPPGFLDAFPGVERTKVKIDYVKPKSVVPVRPSWMQRVLKGLRHRQPKSTDIDQNLPPKPSRKNTMRPPLRSRRKGANISQKRETGFRLFVPVGDLEFKQVSLNELELDRRVQCTIEALNICAKERFTTPSRNAVAFSPALALEFYASFDGGAKSIRHVVYAPFVVGDISGAVIELVRRNEGSIALGIILRTNALVFGPFEVARVMSHYRRRIHLRGATDRPGRENYAGVWPTHDDYDDVRGGRLVHKPPLDSPRFLANAIFRTISELSG